jgi:hypothetical protein
MMALLLALVQDVTVDVRQKAPEVRLVVRSPRDWPVDAAMIRQWTLEAWDGRFEESWAELSAVLPSSDPHATTAEVSLARPGLYQIQMGAGSVSVAVSRSEMKSWKDDVKALRDAARRLEQVAAEIDQAKDPSAAQIAKIRLRLGQERARISKLGIELRASAKALEIAVDRLYYGRTLSRLPAPPQETALPGYGAAPQEKAGQESDVLRATKSLRDLIDREGALILADELRLLLASPETPKGLLRVVRWRDSSQALVALRDAREALGDFPELETLLKEAQEGRSSAEIGARLQKLRDGIVKP